MRRKTGILLLLYAAALLAAQSVFGEAERTLRAEIPDAAHGAFAVENLVGAMHVTAGTGDSVSVVATVHAESGALAGAVRLERVAGDAGAVTLHVRYPEDERTLRYPERGENGDWSFDLFSFSSGDGHRYQGRTYRVSRSRGRLLYVDLEVRLPARVAAGRFLNLVGRIEASGLEGKLAFDVASADVRLERLRGQIALHGTSGDVTASDIGGVWSSEFNSGDCSIRGFRGESLSFRTTSGDVAARDIEASRVRIQTTSGDYSIRDADIVDLEASATSGNVEIDDRGSRLARVRIDATSGDVVLRLPRDASFQADANLSSGDIRIDYGDVHPPVDDQNRGVYRHGTGGAEIRVKTTSGNLTIEPR
jgi:Putative adhesin